MINKRVIKKRIRVPKNCFFCVAKTEPSYKDTAVLNRYVSERGKLQGKAVTGICSKHQRHLSIAIKRSRFMALLPYIIRPS